MNFLKKNKGKITALIIIALLLIGSYMWGSVVPEEGKADNNSETAPKINQELPSEDKSVISLPAVQTPTENKQLPDEMQSEPENEIKPDKPQIESAKESVQNEELDKCRTESTPAGHPGPIEPQTVTITDKELTCTLSVRCDRILDNLELLDDEKKELVPADGIIFAERQVSFYEGESVFNVLLREMKRNGIHFEYVNTPIYNSAYIEGINNLYEFDCGELSGWMYRVDGWFPGYGCSRYQIKEGDRIEWIYTCDLGKDVGNNNIN